MNAYEIVFVKAAQKELASLDGSVRHMVLKGLSRLAIRPLEIGKPLSGALTGCRELKFRSDGIRLIYRVCNGQVQIVEVLAIGARDKGAVFRNAQHRLS